MRVWGRGNLYCKQVWKMAARRKAACIWQHSHSCSLTLLLRQKHSLYSQLPKCHGPKLPCLSALFLPPIPTAPLEEGAWFSPAASCGEIAGFSTTTRIFLASAGSQQGMEAGVQRLTDLCILIRPAYKQGRISPTGGEDVMLCCTMVLRGRNQVKHFVFG